MGNITQQPPIATKEEDTKKSFSSELVKKKLDLTKIKFANLATNAILAFPKFSEVNPWDS